MQINYEYFSGAIQKTLDKNTKCIRKIYRKKQIWKYLCEKKWSIISFETSMFSFFKKSFSCWILNDTGPDPNMNQNRTTIHCWSKSTFWLFHKKNMFSKTWLTGNSQRCNVKERGKCHAKLLQNHFNFHMQWNDTGKPPNQVKPQDNSLWLDPQLRYAIEKAKHLIG